jgi:hypothetical protein
MFEPTASPALRSHLFSGEPSFFWDVRQLVICCRCVRNGLKAPFSLVMRSMENCDVTALTTCKLGSRNDVS